MEKLDKGSWIINTSKHLTKYKANSHELDSFENTSFAGKASMLLSKLSCNNQEIIDGKKVKIFAREAYIEPENIGTYLKALKNEEMVDFTVDDFDRPVQIEVYCFSNNKAIETATEIFNKRVDNDLENANIDLLDKTYTIPMKEEEIKEELENEIGYKEADVENLLELHNLFEITRKNNGIIYNEYLFNGNQDKIVKSLDNLKPKEKEIVNEILNDVSNNQGYLYDKLSNKYDNDILKMMEGIGLIEGIEVSSDIGSATFISTPQIKGNGVGKFGLSTDIFHKAKILLSCLRFGQERSTYGRGKISTEEKMINIIRKLNRGEWLNPCTAAGQDYTLLEKQGVIQVKPAHDGMFYMRLRQKEVGRLVEQMILYNKVVELDDDNLDIIQKINANKCTSPEVRRSNILAQPTPYMKELQSKVLQSIRE